MDVRPSPKEYGGALAPAVLPLPSLLSGQALGSNQDSPDQEGAVKHPEFQQLATKMRVRVTRRWGLLDSMLDFAVLYSLKCWSLPRSSGHG